jgi:uncharacterized protein YodC (DUF2158 family)
MFPGETVRLRSGGPVMTIQAADKPDFVRCSWFDENNKLITAEFNKNGLEPAAPVRPTSGEIPPTQSP